MSQDKWNLVDRYLTDRLVPKDGVLEAALAGNLAAGLPPIDVAPNQGKFLNLLARVRGARRILEIGTLGGYSTIWLARALPADGRLISLEIDPKHAAVARVNLQRAGLDDKVEIRIGPAMESLEKLRLEGAEAFDMVFIDADKPNIPAYLAGSLKLSKVGSLIVVDNVIREGAVADPENPDPAVKGVRRMFEDLAAEPRLSATALQTVGFKGHDGFAMALVVSD
ncbi:MAG TPA: O-methyltransferase [bacterium]|jgi:predicted O-methyltransferase YrrM|nr:O-methyltransferase [bacterium]